MFPHSRSAFRNPIRGQAIPPPCPGRAGHQPKLTPPPSPTGGTAPCPASCPPAPGLAPSSNLGTSIVAKMGGFTNHLLVNCSTFSEMYLNTVWAKLLVACFYILVVFCSCTWTPSWAKLKVAYSFRLVVFCTTRAEPSNLGGSRHSFTLQSICNELQCIYKLSKTLCREKFRSLPEQCKIIVLAKNNLPA